MILCPLLKAIVEVGKILLRRRFGDGKDFLYNAQVVEQYVRIRTGLINWREKAGILARGER